MPDIAMTGLPKITPLVLKRRAAAFDNPDYLYELKYDGFRAPLEIDAAGARLLSRNRNPCWGLEIHPAISYRAKVAEPSAFT
jgi:hypothetical protein